MVIKALDGLPIVPKAISNGVLNATLENAGVRSDIGELYFAFL